MLSPSENEAVQDLDIEIKKTRETANHNRMLGAFGIVGSTLSSGMGAFWGYSFFETTKLNEFVPKPVEYASLAVCGLVGAALFMRSIGSPIKSTKSWLNSRNDANKLEDKRMKLASWLEEPKELSEDDELVVLRFQNQLETFDQEPGRL